MPNSSTSPLAIASCVEGELSAIVESARATSSLTSAAPPLSRFTSGEMAPAFTISTGEPGLPEARSLITRAARRCVPVFLLPSNPTQFFAIWLWLSSFSVASRASAFAACARACSVPSSRMATRGEMPPHLAIASRI